MASVEQPTTSTAQGFDKAATTSDPFAAQREGANPFSNGNDAVAATEGTAGGVEPVEIQAGEKGGKNEADEWDASKTPPSRFQQRKGSVFATPGSRDGHVARNTDRDAKYHEKLAEKGWGKKDRRGSKSSN